MGTSGWAYREWKPDFYPQDLPQRRFLEFYSTRLSACEINATFYRLQSPATFSKWTALTTEPFRFVTKAHRRITHSRRIPTDPWRGFVDRFVSSLAPLGPRLGAVLFQFPPSRARDDALLRALLGAVAPQMPCAVEFRHESWRGREVEALVASLGATVCISDTTGVPPDDLPPGPIGYVRLRAERYSEDQRRAWADLLSAQAGTRDVYAFAKHEGAPPGDPYAGVGLAEWLSHRQR